MNSSQRGGCNRDGDGDRANDDGSSSHGDQEYASAVRVDDNGVVAGCRAHDDESLRGGHRLGAAHNLPIECDLEYHEFVGRNREPPSMPVSYGIQCDESYRFPLAANGDDYGVTQVLGEFTAVNSVRHK